MNEIFQIDFDSTYWLTNSLWLFLSSINYESTSVSRFDPKQIREIRYESTIFCAKSLSVSRIYNYYKFTFFTRILHKFTIFYVNSLRIHYLFEEIHYDFTKDFANSLSFSRIMVTSIFCFGNSLLIDRFFATSV